MKTHFASIALLIVGVFCPPSPLVAASAELSKGMPASTNAIAKGNNSIVMATNSPATDRQLRAIQKQRERLDALYAQLDGLLTKYTEKDRRVRATRKEIADLQKQLVSELAATLPPAGYSGMNRTAKATNNTNAPAKGSNASGYGTNRMAAATDALAAANGTNVLAKVTAAPAQAKNASANHTNALTAKVTSPSASGTNALVETTDAAGKAARIKANDESIKVPNSKANDVLARSNNADTNATVNETDDKHFKATPTLMPRDSGDHSTPTLSFRGDVSTNAPGKGTDATGNFHIQTSAATSDASTNGNSATISTTTNPPVNLVSMKTLDDKHRLAIGDKLSFRIEEDKYRMASKEKLSLRSDDEPTPLLVTDSGELEVPYIGRFPAENKTCKQLAYELKAALEKDYFYKATVILAVDLKTKSRGRVYLNGAVHVPGPQEIPSDEVLTLGKAILRAGGFTDFAERHNVKVTRKAGAGASENKTVVVDVAQVFDKGKTERDLPLEPDDLILISERLIRF